MTAPPLKLWVKPSDERPIVVLTADEMEKSAIVGVRRRVRHLRDGARDKRGPPDDGWRNDIEAAGAEHAFAKYMRIPWDGGVIGNFDEKDVGGKYQVRAAIDENKRLMVRNDAKTSDHDVFIFLTGYEFTFRIWGWILVSDAKRIGCWQDPNGQGYAWFVDKEKLNPMTTLPQPHELP